MQTIKIEMYNFGGGFGGFFDPVEIVDEELRRIEYDYGHAVALKFAGAIDVAPDFVDNVAQAHVARWVDDMQEIFPTSVVSAEVDRIGYGGSTLEIAVNVTNVATFWAELRAAVDEYLPKELMPLNRYYGFPTLRDSAFIWAPEMLGQVYNPEFSEWLSKLVAVLHNLIIYNSESGSDFQCAVADDCTANGVFDIVGTTPEAAALLDSIYNPA